MARFTTDTAAADPVRPYLEGVAKSLVDRLYGEKGPAWGTKLSAIESTIKSLRRVLSEKMLDEALQRQAKHLQERPAELQRCPKCDGEVEDRHRDEPAVRILETDVGEAEWLEPECYCRKCRRAFFPQSKSLGVDRSGLSPELQRKVVYAGTKNGSFQQGSEDLAQYLDFDINAKQVERVTERIGWERCAERDAAVAAYQELPLTQRKSKPDDVTAPAVAVVGVDGGRLQIRDDSWPSPSAASSTAAADAAAETAAAASLADEHGGTHWREDKIGLLMTMNSDEQASDPCPEVPAGFLDPTRITKLARELKTKKAAGVADSEQEVAAATDRRKRACRCSKNRGRKAAGSRRRCRTST